MKIISANQNRILNIGKVGENLVSAVEFDLTEFFQAYTSGTPALIVRQAGTDTLYLADLAVNEEKAVWVIQRSDVSRAGTGACQLRFYSGETVALSPIWSISVSSSLSGAESEPEDRSQTDTQES